ncbi:MAG TPA: DNA-3-methyladenine glycosylase I [Marmoricola sp.]|nr:DNA-3-methyladenine glycosylase I [Marmoricola sp.]
MTDRLYLAPDGDLRCGWAGGTPQYLAYHDTEWGFPVRDDRRLFEKVSLEGFQSGLSWRTILEKRENFRAAFAGFDFDAVAEFDGSDVERLLQDAGIVRHRGKIEAVINNAARAQEVVAEAGSLADYFWSFEPATPAEGQQAAVMMAKDLKKRGWRFVGPTTAYAFIQAMGLVNDHLPECVIRDRIPVR